MSNSPEAPIIVGFVSDLMFSSRIENVARHLGFQMAWVGSASALGDSPAEAPRETPGESLLGASGALFTRLSQWQPALLIFDLGNGQVPWQRWIPALKASPATRRIPILAYGPHVDQETLERAEGLGADVVLRRSRFAAAMPEMLKTHALLPDYQGAADACQQPLSPLALKGIALHNQGEYFQAHEELEAAWNADQSEGRKLYQGMLQVGIAYLQIQRGNYRGALKMCLRVRQWLAPLPDVCRGVDVARLRQDVNAVHEALLALGPDQLGELDRSLLAPIRFN